MNPLFRPTVCLLTAASFAVGAHDGGKTQKPPANAVGHLVLSNSSVTTTVQVTGMMPDAIAGKIYDTAEGRRGFRATDA
jgi:hypothetical protein